MPQATELLGDPDTYHAYSARVRGQEGRPPVAKAAGLYASGEDRGGEDLTAMIGVHPSDMPPEPHSRSAGM